MWLAMAIRLFIPVQILQHVTEREMVPELISNSIISLKRWKQDNKTMWTGHSPANHKLFIHSDEKTSAFKLALCVM